ncbi:MAG: hypothetical protein LBQ75_01360 [Zoogloeaceae bacterium]|jgi:hypothetical protein|nr:hypothetical protein [Zoogloeaceae bacterium]
MSELTFTFFEALQAAGVPDDKAKATVESLNQAIDTRYAIHARELATRGDIEKVRADMEKIRAELSTEIIKIEANLIKWLVGVGIAAVITLYGLLKIPV